MVKKQIIYKDTNGNTITEEFLFNINRHEMIMLEGGQDGGYSQYLETMVATQDVKKLLSTIEEVVTLAYGYKSDDGKSFLKTPERTQAFIQSEAFVELYVELLNNEAYAAEFLVSLLPTDMLKQVVSKEDKGEESDTKE